MIDKMKKYLNWIVRCAIICELMYSCSTGTQFDNEEPKDQTSTSKLFVEKEYVTMDRDVWLNGGYLDTLPYNRKYTHLISHFSQENLLRANMVQDLYPRSVSEMNILYDSLVHATGERLLFFRQLDSALFRYADQDSTDCFALYLNMVRYMDPRRLDIDWIAQYSLDIYYYIIPDNLDQFKKFLDTCDYRYYYGMDDWIVAYENAVSIGG